MGKVKRRGIEKSRLTASNAKKNRVSSELKVTVEAPLWLGSTLIRSIPPHPTELPVEEFVAMGVLPLVGADA